MSIKHQDIEEIKVIQAQKEEEEEKKQNAQKQAPVQEQKDKFGELDLSDFEIVDAHAIGQPSVDDELRDAHLALHRKTADSKSQDDRKSAYNRKKALKDDAYTVYHSSESTRRNRGLMITRKLNEQGIELPNDRKTKANLALTSAIGLNYQDSTERSIDMMKNLSVSLQSATPEQIVGKRKDLERIFATILELDLDQFTFQKAEDLIREEISDQLTILSISPHIGPLVGEYRKMMGMNCGCQLSEEMLTELQARTMVMQKFNEAYNDRLKLMSNKYYSLLLEEDTAGISDKKLKRMQKEARDVNNTELADYLKLVRKRNKAKKDGKYTAARRGESALDILKQERDNLSLKGEEGLDVARMDRLHAEAHGIAQQISPEEMKKSLNSRRMRKKNVIGRMVRDISAAENLPKDVMKTLARIAAYTRVDQTSSHGGKERKKNARENNEIWTYIKYGLALAFRQSKTGKKVEQERHDLRISIKNLRELIGKYSQKDPARYGLLTSNLKKLADHLVNESGTPPVPLTEEEKNSEYEKRGWNRKEGEYTELDLRGRPKHIYEDDRGEVNSILVWASENDMTVDARKSVLFAHEPCLEDITQGCMGDCYFLAALGSVVQKDPKKIRDMMMDNGDGSVTVRFYDRKDNFKPVYITVTKEVRLTGAFHTVWVQVMEKAYTAYLQRENKNVLELHRGDTKPEKVTFDHNTIEYGFITKGGYSEESIEALTGVQGLSISLNTERIRVGKERSTTCTNILKSSYRMTLKERNLSAAREEEFAHDQKLRDQVLKFFDDDAFPEEYDDYIDRLNNVERKRENVQRGRQQCIARLQSAPENEQEDIRRELADLNRQATELANERIQIENEFEAEYIRRHEDEIESTRREIAELQKDMPESDNVLLETEKLADTYTGNGVRHEELYLSREVDTELLKLIEKNGGNPSKIVLMKIRRKLAKEL